MGRAGHGIEVAGMSDRPFDSYPLIAEVQQATAAAFGIDIAVMRSHRGAQSDVIPRQAAIYLACQLTRHSLPGVARSFGRLHHTTALHARRATARRILDGDRELACTIANARREIARLVAQRY